MIARFKKNSYQWSPLAVILIIMLGCVSLPDAEHKEAVVTSAAKLSPATKANGPTYRLVLDSKIAGMPVNEGDLNRLQDFSPSGDQIVFESQGKLYIADETGTGIRPILDDLGPWGKPRWPRWSPDGRQIAYVASNTIFVLSPEGGTPRKISPELRGRFSWLRWTCDGKHLTFLGRDGVHTLALDGSKVRFIPSKDLPGRYNIRKRSEAEYSPNGRWLAYCGRSEDGARDIWIIPAAGGQAQALTHLPEFNGHVTWAPDSRTLYFVSGPHSGTRNIWKLPMDPKTGLAKGEPQQVTFFKDVHITWPKVLGDGSRIAFTMRRESTSIQVADASSPHEARTLAHSCDYAPRLSPDGQTVYYLSNTPGEEGIYAVPRQGGAPRRLTESLGVGCDDDGPPFELSPDGRTLAYCAKLGKEQGLFTLPASGGEPHLLVKTPGDERGYSVVPQWSPDGSNLAYTADKGLYVIPAAGGKPRKLAHMDGRWEMAVCWSPDGKSIAAIGCPKPESDNAVFVVPASGGELRQLTPALDGEWKEWVEWHPDGKRLTYHVSLSDSETRQAYLDGRPPTFLANAPDTWDWHGRWAPDGRRYFFVSWGGDGASGIFVYDEASGETKLCIDVPDATVPCWSRDGKTMAWSVTRKTARQTWIMENFLPTSVSQAK